ncbi:MAG: DNA-protecting protein DprA [Clostridiales bacterium]|nr:DNA-protecting protein DprA [Clostridiales bacterium]
MTLEYWIWLQQTLGAGSNRLVGALDKFGDPEAIYRAGADELRAAGIFTGTDLRRLSNHDLSEASKILETCGQKGYDLLTAADERYPKRLLRIFNPPALLYMKGELPPIDDEVVVAVVGTRRATLKGIEAAASLAARLARAGVLIVSGGAEGIDGAAHRGALAVDARTVAVLGGGLDVCYPRVNEELRKEIAGHGCLLSEYPPGARPLPCNYPVRNRIMAALSLGTVVIEAGEGSGALLTAGHALEQGKDIFVLPGEVGAPNYVGSNWLIQDGAKLLLSAMDVLEEYVDAYPHKLDLRTAFDPMPSAHLEALAAAMQGRPAGPPRRRKPSAGKSRTAGAKGTNTSGIQREVERTERVTSEEMKPETHRAKANHPETQEPCKRKTAGLSQEKNSPNPPPEGLTDAARRLYESFPEEASGVDGLSAAAGLPAGEILPALTELEIFGLIKALPGGRYQRL